jgi:hypothetical protein
MSLTHMVCFKYKPDVPEALRSQHRTRLQCLAGLPGVVALMVGGDVVGSARSFDTGLIVTFTDRAALDGYQKDPLHVPVAQFGVSLCEQIVAVDFDS